MPTTDKRPSTRAGRRSLIVRLAWMAGLWLGGVLVVSGLAWGIRLVMNAAGLYTP